MNTKSGFGGFDSAALSDSRPIVLVGRGGSGTRMLSELARSSGIFVGSVLNSTGDSVEWVDTLYQLAIEVTQDRVEPDSARDAMWRKQLHCAAADFLAAGGLAPSDPWGWKLPETILALPQVLGAFPRACVVHLVRHPVTSALRRTHLTSRMDNPVGRAVMRAAYRGCGFDVEKIASDEEYVHNAASWTFQVARALDALESAPSVSTLQLRYEDLCATPHEMQRKFASFVALSAATDSSELTVEENRIHHVASDDERAERVWSIAGNTALRLGYGRAAW